MARPRPYVFCRYQITDDDDPITADEEYEMLQEIKGVPISYHKADPRPEDRDTYLIKVRKKEILRQRVHTWEVVRDIKLRARTQYDRKLDETVDELVSTNEIQHTKFLALPNLGVLAVDDHSTERALGARTAVIRFEAIIEDLMDNYEARVVFAGSPADAQRALTKWHLEEFRFTIRPFNPTPRKLGEKFHEIMVADRIGKLTARATPTPGQDIRDSHEGLISEVKGLSDAGYGQFGASGRTPEGLSAEISKPKFDLDKEVNLENQAKGRIMKVMIDKLATLQEEEQAIVKALLGLYG